MKFDETRLVEQLYPTTGSSSNVDIAYYVRSSVLGGAVLTELNGNGDKVLTNVFTGSEALAEQRTNALTSDYVVWHHKDPVTGSFDSSVKNGSLFGDDEPEFKAEFEPLGAVLPQEDPALNPDNDPMPVQYRKQGGGIALDSESGCFWDGVPLNGGCSGLAFILRTQNTQGGGIYANIRTPGGYQLQSMLDSSLWRYDVVSPDSGDDYTPVPKKGPIKVSTRDMVATYYILYGNVNFALSRTDDDELKFLVRSIKCIIPLIDVYSNLYRTFSKDPTIADNAGKSLYYILLEGWRASLTVEQTAYVMATAESETSGFSVLSENGEYTYFENKYGYKSRKASEFGHTKAGQGALYRGHGLIMLTGLINHQWASSLTGIDLVNNPTALNTDFNAMAKIAVIGVRDGQFGDPISNYINKGKTDFKGARNSVNSLDYTEKRDEIAKRAPKYLNAIKSCY